MAACEFICMSERHRPGEEGPGHWDCVHLTAQLLSPSVRGRETSAWQPHLSCLKNLCLNLNKQPFWFFPHQENQLFLHSYHYYETLSVETQRSLVW